MAAPHREVLTRAVWDSKYHRIGDYDPDVLQAQVFDHNFQLPFGDRDIPRPGMLYAKIPFSFELAGSGTAGTAPANAVLIEACGFTGTNLPATSETYSALVPGGETAVDIDFHPGNALKYSCNDAVGNFSLELLPGQPAKFMYEFAGRYDTPAETPDATTLGTTAKAPICKALVATIGGNTLVLKRLLINLNNELLSPRSDIAATHGVAPPLIVDSGPTIEATIEIPDYSTANYWTDLLAETKTAFSAVLGSVAGNICTITVDGYLAAHPATAFADKLAVYNLVYRMGHGSGDTELSLIYT